MGLLARYLPPADIDPDDVVLMRRVGVTMFFSGAASALLGIFTVQETAFGRQSQAVLALALIALGIAFLLARPRTSLFRVGVIGATTVISAMVATAQPVSTTEFFYLWPVVFAAYFLGRRCTVVTVLWLAVTLAVALTITKDDLVRSDVFLSTLSSVGLVGAVVLLMRERERRLLRGLTAAARTDALTGLLNRHGLEPELELLVARARQTGVPLAVALFDIDHFKWFNDAHGHLQGDEALRRIGAVLRDVTRSSDCVARFGGEEFVVFLPGSTAEGGKAFADRVAAALDEREVGEEALRITASCGVAELVWDEEIDGVLARADEALYAAKDAGRNRTAWWEGDRLRVGAPLGGAELQARRNVERSPRAYVIRMADRAREISPEPMIDDGAGAPRRFG